MVSKRVKQSTKRQKRRFTGNKWTRLNSKIAAAAADDDGAITATVTPSTPGEEEIEQPVSPVDSITTKQRTASQSKIDMLETDTPSKKDSHSTGNRIMDMEVLSGVIESLNCPECNTARVKLHENFSEKKGLASKLVLKCCCGFEKQFYTSKEHKQSGIQGGGRGFDINKRIVYGLRSCGQGYASLEKLLALLNMPRPMTKMNYNKIVKTIEKAVTEVAKQTMSDSAAEIKEQSDNRDGPVDIGVSVDGSWQKRGYSSLNGNVAVIALDGGKVLDVEPMSRHCRQCKAKADLKKENIDAYNEWFRKHENHCTLNYKGSAGGMEVAGSKRIFKRSIENHNLRYVKYLGDGDSKGFEEVKNTYEGKVIDKLECIGHIQKRVGSRLRELKKKTKGLGGKGKLTDKMVDKFQNYYGIALRSNLESVEAMKKAIYAAYLHVASSATNSWHDHCPDGASSWCQFKKDKAMGTKLYKPGKGLPTSITCKIKPIFDDLTKNELLEKCLHGRTQNQNESFNGMIWERIPKVTYVALNLFRLGVYDAVAHFNIGWKASILVFEKLSIVPGRYCTKNVDSLNRKRLFNASYKDSEKAKKRRKIIRSKAKAKGDKIEQTEGVLYEAGGF